MTVKEFVDFNWQKDKNDRCICNICDVYVIIMNKFSFKSEDKVLESLISVSNLSHFNEYEIIHIGKHTINTETSYTTIKLIIYKKENKEGDEKTNEENKCTKA